MPQQPNNSSLVYNGQVISQRPDGYVNATQMAKANGKEVKHWLSNAKSKEYINHLSSVVGIPTTRLVITVQGGNAENQGTWIHPKLAVELGRWVSVDFAIWCDTHIKTLIETGNTNLAEQQPVQQLPPKRDVIDYVAAHKYLVAIADLTIQQLMRDKLEEELYQATGKLKPQLPPEKPKEYTIVKVRARELGYTDKEIGNGSILGRFVCKHIEPAYVQRVGKYEVRHYEVGDRLDTVIKTYFGLKRSLGK